MGSQYLTNPLVFVVSTAFSLYVLAFMLRFLLQWVHADFYNPFSQFLVRITQPLLRPLRRVVPGFGGIDVAALLVMLALQVLSVIVLAIIQLGGLPGPGFIVIKSVGDLVGLLLNVFLVAVIVQAILSWVAMGGGYHPIMSLLDSLTEPVLRPARQILPPIGGLDLSPLIVLVIIQVAKMLILPPIYHLAYTLG